MIPKNPTAATARELAALPKTVEQHSDGEQPAVTAAQVLLEMVKIRNALGRVAKKLGAAVNDPLVWWYFGQEPSDRYGVKIVLTVVDAAADENLSSSGAFAIR
jgi:hypothetical protein